MQASAKCMAQQGIVYAPGLTQFYQGVAHGGLEQDFDYGGKVDQYLILDGTKLGAYVETDAVGPQSVYGETKLAGERAIVAAGGTSLIMRTSWVAGAHGGNFAKTMLKLALLGPAGARRYLRDSRLRERVVSRLRAGLAG